jgi:endoglucanase
MKSLKKTLALIAVIITAAGAQTNPLNMTTMQVVKDMGLGINLGNTFEAIIVCEPGDQGCVDWVNSMETLETSWGSPAITEAMIRGYANAGLKTVRIPVAWSNKMEDNYTISPALLNRVDEVVGWVLSNGMYAIVNIHYDGGWWKNFPSDSANCMTKYKRIWEQVSEKFKNRSGYLVFESLNEEGSWDGNKARAYGLLNAINQEFTNLVRASGGNNANRHLLIAGYETNIDKTIDAAFKMPTDPQNRQAVSVHYYDPFGFTHINRDGDWAPKLTTWGTDADYNELNGYMDKLKTAFVDKNIPVIVGEYGFASDLVRAQSEIRKYTLAVAEAIYSRNMCPVLWDIYREDRSDYYNRNTATFPDQLLVTGFKDMVPATVPIVLPRTSYSNTLSAMQNAINLQVNGDAVIQIFNIKGKVVRTLRYAEGNYVIPLGDLPTGLYIARASNASWKKTIKVNVVGK